MSYSKLNIGNFFGMFSNADPQDLKPGTSIELRNAKPKNGRLIQTNEAARNANVETMYNNSMTPTQVSAITQLTEFVNDNIVVASVSRDSILLAVSVNKSTGLLSLFAYDVNGDSWELATAIDMGGGSGYLFSQPSNLYLLNQVNNLIKSWNTLRILPGNVSAIGANDVTPVWIGWIDRDRFDQSLISGATIDPKFYILNGQILNESDTDKIMLSFDKQYIDKRGIEYQWDAVIKAHDAGAPSTTFIVDIKHKISQADDFYNNMDISIEGIGNYDIEDYDAGTRAIVISSDIVTTEIPLGTDVVLNIRDGSGTLREQQQVDYYYKISCIYDQAQESLLSERTYNQSAGQDEAVIITTTIDPTISKRITGINIYRSTKRNGEYYKIQTIDIIANRDNLYEVVTDSVYIMTKIFVDDLSSFTFNNGTHYYLYLYDMDKYIENVSALIDKPDPSGVPDESHYIVDLGSSLDGTDMNLFDIVDVTNNTFKNGNTNGFKYGWRLYDGSNFIAYGDDAYFGLNCLIYTKTDLTSYGLENGSNIKLDLNYAGKVYVQANRYLVAEDASDSSDITIIETSRQMIQHNFDTTLDYQYRGVFPGYYNETAELLGTAAVTADLITINAGQGLIETDDYYNGKELFVVEEGLFITTVTDYEGATRTFTISPLMSSTHATVHVNILGEYGVTDSTCTIGIAKSNDSFKASYDGSNFVYESIDYGLLDGVIHPLIGEKYIIVNGKYGIFAKGRMFVANVVLNPGGGDEEEVHEDWLSYSEFNQPDVMPVSNYVPFNDNDGGPITGLQVLGDEILIIKKNHIYTMNISDGNPANWPIRKSSHNIGSVGERTSLVVRGSLYISSYDGIYKLTPNNLAESDRTPTKTLKISDPIQDILDGYIALYSVAMEHIEPHYSPKEGVIHFHYYNSDADQQTDFVYDLETLEWRKSLSTSYPVIAKTSYVGADGELEFTDVDDSGYLYEYTGSSARIYWKSGIFVLSDLRHEIIRNVNIVYNMSGAANQVTFKIYDADTDDELWSKTLATDITSEYNNKTYGARIRAKRFYIEISSGSTAISGFKLHSISVEHTGE